MSLSHRDERWKVYGYSDVGTDGRANPVYSGIGEWWARMVGPSGREVTMASQAGQRVDGVVVFGDEAVIPSDGFLRGPDEKLYRILAVPFAARGSSALSEQLVPVVYAEDSAQVIVEDATNALTFNAVPLTFGGQTLTYSGA